MRLVFDLAALIARVTIGVIFVAHGWQKWQAGPGSIAQMFTQSGVPYPELAAGFTTIAELVGGSFLILGMLVRVAALALLAVSAGAIIFVHAKNGIFVADMGWELVGALGACCLLLLATGGGRIGVDGIVNAFFRRRRTAELSLPEAPVAAPSSTVSPNVRTVTDVPRQPAPPPPAGGSTPPQPPQNPGNPGNPGNPRLSDDDMKAIDALMSDDQPRKNPPDNRA
ncbi:DoxX family protein [Nonomuraea typhae]|uniref:DoxX family protein n=1 Tax=Nonomuraea typhae TaxID=2603600 RepID=UPI0012FAE46F|nr:DoxX family protein [Nonomuraea typhae]